MTRAMVTLFTAKPEHQATHRRPVASARHRRSARLALLAVISKLT
jgi:hypothetical protein